MLTNLFVLLISAFGGILAGYVLSLIAPEELEYGKPYFVIFQNVTFSLFVLTAVYYFAPVYVLPIVSALVIIGLGYVFNVAKLLYLPASGVFFFIGESDILLLAGLMFFLTGVGASSYEATKFVKNEKIKNKLKLLKSILKYYSWTLLFGLLPFLISYAK
ncbi:MAG: hypothetical protein ACOCQG_05380 [Candidatus Nanoarchaeia archaeon]